MITRKNIFSILLFALLPFMFLWPTLHSPQSFFMRDITYLFHPWRTQAQEMLQSGIFPTWNSQEMGGMPFLANCQSAILYPLTIPFYLLGFSCAQKLFYWLHYFLAALGMFLCCKKMGCKNTSTFLGGLLWAYNGHALTRLEFLSALGSYIWMPWVFILFWNGNTTRRRIVFTGLALCLSLFAGYPQMTALQLLALGITLIFSRKKIISTWAFISSIGAFLILACAQWVPTAELMQHSVRGQGGIQFSEAASYSLPWQGLWGLVTPFYIPNNIDRFTGEKFFWIWSAWWGIIATGLALFGIFSRRKKTVFYTALLLLIAVTWSLGENTFIYKWAFTHIKILHSFRYPPVALYLGVFAIALLAPLGLERWRNKWVMILICSLSLAELWIYSQNFLPVIHEKYFFWKSPSIAALQKSKHGTVFLSPKMDRQRQLAGVDSFTAALEFRARLFDLTNLPYKIRTTAISGEPLALKSFHDLYQTMLSFPTLEQARHWLNLFNVTHFITEDILDDSWTLIYSENSFHIYENPRAVGEFFAMDPSDHRFPDLATIIPLSYREETNGVQVTAELSQDRRIVGQIPFFPGWKVVDIGSEGVKNLTTQNFLEYWSSIVIEKGKHRIIWYYDPPVWQTAMTISLFAFCALAGWGIFLLQRQK